MQISDVARGPRCPGEDRGSTSRHCGRLGVSVSTVSRALANEAGISPTVRDDVRQMARTMGYRSKRAGGTLLDRRVAAFVPLGSATSGLSGFYFGIVEGMRAAAAHAGISLDVRLINETQPSVDFIRRYLKETGAVGLLLAGIDATEELVAWSFSEDLPVVLVNGIDPQMRWARLRRANYYGALPATRRLLDAGPSKNPPLHPRARPTIDERRRGFEAAIIDVPGASAVVIDSRELTRPEFTERLVRGEYDVSAVFLGTTSSRSMCSRRSRGAGPASTYSIVGFDDLPIASLATPRLSTVHVDREAIGAGAIRLLRQQIDGDRSCSSLRSVCGWSRAKPFIRARSLHLLRSCKICLRGSAIDPTSSNSGATISFPQQVAWGLT